MGRRRLQGTWALPTLLAACLTLAAPALAAPSHPRTPAQDVTNLNHACGLATDSKGDLYAASAGEAKVKVFGPGDHATPIAEISNANEPCGLAVDSKGNLYVSEAKTGLVVRYHPSAYPFVGAPSYEAPVTIDASGKAKGIAVDPTDDFLYVAEGDRVAVFDSGGVALPPQNEVQKFSVINASGGFFKLEFEGQTTAPIAKSASSAEVQAALAALSTIGAGNVSVTESDEGYLVEFIGKLATTNVGLLGGDSSELTGAAATVPVGEKTTGFSGHIGEGDLIEATGVAAYTYRTGSNGGAKFNDHYLDVADAAGGAPDRVEVFSGTSPTGLKSRRQIDGSTTPDGSFGFGAAGAYLAADPGNREAAGEKCVSVAEQACTSGHFFLFDAAHGALDEFDASGEFLDRTESPGFADAGPTAIAVERSGGAGDGTIYVSAGQGAGAKALAFGPLKAPSRAVLGEPLSHVFKNALAVATDSRGYLYAAAGSFIRVYGPDGAQIKLGPEGKGIEDTHTLLKDLAVDSEGHVFVLEEDGKAVTYYTPSAYPPTASTTYARHEPALLNGESFPKDPFNTPQSMNAIAVNPGPGAGRDHLFAAVGGEIHEYDSIAHGSTLLNGKFAKGLLNVINIQSLAVDGRSGNLFVAHNGYPIHLVNAAGTEVLARINTAGGPKGPAQTNPFIAVDQSNGHLLEFDGQSSTAREYDSSGAFVAEFGGFTEGLSRNYRVAIDSSCATHQPPLDETTTPTCAEYDPANGTVYVAFDDTNPAHPPFDVSAFGPLSYGEAPGVITGAASGLGGGAATLNGSVNPNGFEVESCRFQYIEAALYAQNEGEAKPPFEGAEEAQCEPEATALGKGTKAVAVHADVTLPDPEVSYRFRVVAANPFGEVAGEAVLFGASRIEARGALPVAYTEATLRAKIDPSGLATTYRFQYGLAGEEYEFVTAPQELAADAGPTEVKALISGLAEGTGYRFRVLVENEVGAAQGPEREFTTLARRPAESCPNAEYRTGFSSSLPDCRAYELVTPAQANGLAFFVSTQSSPVAFDNWLTPPRGPGAGDALSYYTGGTLPGFEGNGVFDGYRAARASGDHPATGWQTRLVGPTFKEAVPGVSSTPTVQGLSADQLYSVWGIHPEEASAELPPGTYLRVPDGTANPQCLAPPLPAHLDFELLGCGSLGTDPSAAGRFISRGGAHVIFTSKAHLEGAAPPAGAQAIYDRPAGSLDATVLSQPPSGSSAAERAQFEAALGAKDPAEFLGASADGATVAFRVGASLYVRGGDAGTEAISPRTATVGDTVACAAGSLPGVESERHFQWLRNGAPIAGASGGDVTSSTDYTTVPADEGTALQCFVKAHQAGPGTVAVSAPVEIAPLSPAQSPQPPAEIAAPSPAGPGAGTVETCAAGSWNGATSISYQWYVNGAAILGATSETYEVQAADVPGTIQCVVSGSNAEATVAKASGPTTTSPAPAETAPIASADAAAKATYAGISEDGRYVFYVLGGRASPARLFRFDAEGETATEIAPDSTFIDVSGDGLEVFFSSTKVLTGGEENGNGEVAQLGARNLYRFDFASSTTHFVARLDSADLKSAAFGGIEGMNLAAWVEAVNPSINGGQGLLPTRSTPDGSALVFMSHARLTPYQNEGVAEIYRYDSAAPPGEELTCPSCDPSGSPPSEDPLLQDLRTGVLIAHVLLPNLSDDGSTVVFTTADRLLPEDANAAADVYEWRARGSTWGRFEGAPTCQRQGGCLALISSGQGERDSVLFSASADGHDIFFRTLERLVGADVPGSVSIYDAREGGGIPEPPVEAPCEGDACQGAGDAPPTLSTPATTGSGNGNEAAREPSRCAKGKHRVKGRCVRKHVHKHRKRHNRANSNPKGGRR